jgi:ABC-type uncharacterized transport system YnjBCD permease subunit
VKYVYALIPVAILAVIAHSVSVIAANVVVGGCLAGMLAAIVIRLATKDEPRDAMIGAAITGLFVQLVIADSATSPSGAMYVMKMVATGNIALIAGLFWGGCISK